MDGWAIALVPAHNEGSRIACSVAALRSIETVAFVVVVDDGSSDRTAQLAVAAGARCLRLEKNLGKGQAMNAGIAAIKHWLLIANLAPPGALLLADADLGPSAVHLKELVQPVLAGRLELAIADLPPQRGAAGFGIGMAMARRTLLRHGGRDMNEPLSGQRAIAWAALGFLYPFACGFGVEVAMTIDALQAGLRVGEIAVPVSHRATRRDPGGMVHRARQAAAIAIEVVRREVRTLPRLRRAMLKL
jgi:glycosyltransferase involved in cell wall biosynthesis